jgi:adenylate cyclase
VAAAVRQSRNQRLQTAFHREELRAIKIMSRTAIAVVACLLPWITIENGLPAAFFLHGLVAALLLLLLLMRFLLERDYARRWPWYLFVTSAAAICTFAFIADNPLQSTEIPIAYRLGLGNQAYLSLIIVLSAFSFSPKVVICSGMSCASAWIVATGYALSHPDSLLPISAAEVLGLPNEQLAVLIGDPRRVDIGESIRHILAMLGVTAVVALSVEQARRLVSRQVEAEDRRTNLARYFSPDLVEQLAGGDEDILRPSSHEVTIIFIDIVGFTRMVESWQPVEVLDLLRNYHGIVAPIVFEHSGTIDKYLGDGIMITFGTLAPGAEDAADAMRCSKAILAAIDSWNHERCDSSGPALDISFGLHAGRVVSGNVGGSERLEYTVIGDAVNVASRVEHLTRELGTRLLASDAVVGQIEDPALRAGLSKRAAQHLPGRRATIDLWALGDEGEQTTS